MSADNNAPVEMDMDVMAKDGGNADRDGQVDMSSICRRDTVVIMSKCKVPLVMMQAQRR